MRKTGLALGAAITASAMMLSGCAGGGADTGAEAVYIEAIQDDPVSMNPAIASSPTVQRLGEAMLDPLVGITSDFVIFPSLAQEWEWSDDARMLTLHLAEGVTWHDGEPFTSADVVFNFEEIMPLQTYAPAMLAVIDSVEATDDHTVVLELNGEYGPFMQTLALQYMLPKHIYEGTDPTTNPANMAPIGTGPMMFDHFSSGEEVVLVKNPNYFRGEVQVDRAVYPIMPDDNTRTLALIAGEIDQAEIPASQQDQIAEHPELVHRTTGYFPQGIILQMNAVSEPLSDVDVRAAVFAAINRDEITEVALKGLGEPAQGFFPPSLSWAVNEDVNFDEDFPGDIDAINAALDGAGYPVGEDGTRFTLDVKYISTLTDTADAAEQIKAMLADVGVGVNLEGVTSAIFIEQIYTESNFDLALLRTTVSADPSLGIARWYVCNPDRMGARNPSGICDAQIDAAAEGALLTIDQDARGDFFKEMQQRSEELIFDAPLAWTNASFPTVNTAKWNGLVDPDPDTASTDINWLTMTPVR
ncbi:ABC transporter substrate-binding protein [Microbacterium sediminicola]|uniref:ABC transporter substrate-binding protein n=1 Tax=Microbacterium sediminicola TaxID=415210 RepID=A0ABP4U163_9MICO